MKFKINVLIYTEKHTWLFSESKKKYIEQSIAFKNQPVVCYFSKSINKFYFETPKQIETVHQNNVHIEFPRKTVIPW